MSQEGNSIKQKIQDLEANRKKALYKIGLASFVLIPLSIILGFSFGMGGTPMASLLIALVPIITLIIIFQTTMKKIKRAFKLEVIKRIVKEYNQHLEYSPQAYINRTIFENTNLFSGFNNFFGEDLIYGQVGETHIQMSELTAVSRDSEDESTTIFKGLFIEADFHKYFHSRTYVLPETAWKGVGLHKRKWAGANLTEMEDVDFEDEFRVFTTDDQDARYILSPKMMRSIVDLQNKFQCKVHIAFLGTKMYIAIATGHMNFFETDAYEPYEKDALYKQFKVQVEFILSTIDDLNLNTRIWTKQEGLDLKDIDAVMRDEKDDDLYTSK